MTTPDVVAGKAVVHVIDSVLIPLAVAGALSGAKVGNFSQGYQEQSYSSCIAPFATNRAYTTILAKTVFCPIYGIACAQCFEMNFWLKSFK